MELLLSQTDNNRQILDTNNLKGRVHLQDSKYGVLWGMLCFVLISHVIGSLASSVLTICISLNAVSML